MANFPTLTVVPNTSSQQVTLDDLAVDRASNGTPRVRAFYTAPKKKFVLVFEGATAADKASVEAFYTTNRLLAISYTWPGDGSAYTCYFGAPIQYQPLPALYWRITVELLQA